MSHLAAPSAFSFHRPGLIALALTGLVLSGCAVGPDYQMPSLSLPDGWTHTDAETPTKPVDLSNWWRRLGDPLLDRLIEDAIAGNLDVATAKAKVREARASYRQAGGKLLPSLDAGASATRSRSGSTSSADGRVGNQYQGGFDASWELDLFGANRRNLEAAQSGMDAAQEDLRATLLTLIGDVAANYVEARGYQARIALAQRTAASQWESANLTRTQFEAGASSAVDLANATGQASTTEATIPSLKTSYVQTVHRLSVLTGRPPAQLDAQMSAAKPIPRPTQPVPTGVPANILMARPDVRLAERQLAQATAKIGVAEAARYPGISLAGSIATNGVQLGDLAKATSISWLFGPSLSLPIFNGGQLKAAVDIAAAQRDQYFLALQASVLTALEDVENAIIALSQERIRNEKLAAAVTAYRQSARLSRALYETGNTSFLDVLDAERSLYSAEDSQIVSDLAITTNYIALNKALGGGWDGIVDTDTPIQIKTESEARP